MTIFVIWQLRVTLDSIRNFCDVFQKQLNWFEAFTYLNVWYHDISFLQLPLSWPLWHCALYTVESTVVSHESGLLYSGRDTQNRGWEVYLEPISVYASFQFECMISCHTTVLVSHESGVLYFGRDTQYWGMEGIFRAQWLRINQIL